MKRIFIFLCLLVPALSVHAQEEVTATSLNLSATFAANSDIYFTDFVHDPVNLTNSDAYDAMPIWSPDGKQIAFISSSDYSTGYAQLYLLTPETRDIQQVSDINLTTEVEISWSPDSQLIALTLDDIYIVNLQADSTQALNLYSGARSLNWSQNGERLIFQYAGELFSVNIDGSNLQSVIQPYFPAHNVDVSPVSDEVAFMAYSEEIIAGIYRLDLSNPTPNLVLDTAGYEVTELTWSPDGQQIAFHAYSSTNTFVDIFVVNSDGSDLRSVTGEANDSLGGWSPDSQYIVYWAGEPGGSAGEFYAVNVLNNRQVLLENSALEALCEYGSCRLSIRP